MKQQDYQRRITAKTQASKVFEKISCIPEWWTQGFKGRAQAFGDTFTVQWGDTFVDFRVSEVIPNRKIVWQVTDCNLPWLKDKKEWNGTEVVWEHSAANGTTSLHMLHRGLVPDVECYAACES
jgi:hypothetical protein